MNEKPIVVKDVREIGFFQIDNVILDEFPTLTSRALLVYLVLCRHANNTTQQCCLFRETIATKARISREGVVRSIKELCELGLITSERSPKFSANIYTLNKVKKLANEIGKSVAESPHPSTHSESTLDSPAVRPSTHHESAINKEFELDLSNKTKPTPTPSDEGVIQQVFKFYVEKLGKSSIYELTPKRLAMALARFRESVKKNNGCRKTAQEWLEIAVEQMQASDFHMGRDKRFPGKVHTDWELLFRSPDKFNSWLEKSHE